MAISLCACSAASGAVGLCSGTVSTSRQGLASSSTRSSVFGGSILPSSSKRVLASPSPYLIFVAAECVSLGCVSSNYRPKSGCTQGGVLRYMRGFYTSNPIRRRLALKNDEQNESSFDSFAAQARDFLADRDHVELNFFERLALAWSILFPPVKRKSSTNADIAKQRLKMILISDRCSVNDEAKRKIVNNIVGALSDFVEIESEDKVQLTVSSDAALGTVYSVTVPVRRVKPAYQEYSRELQNVSLAEEFDDEFRTLDIRLEYPYPDAAVDTPQQ